MIYGDTAYHGSISWLTVGVSEIAPWRNSLAMLLSFPGVVLYGIALLSLEKLIIGEGEQKKYHTLTIFGMTPWLCLHLFYIMILYAFAWLTHNGYGAAALPLAEALYAHLSWLVIVSVVIMLPPFLYWFYVQITGRTVFPKKMAFTNMLFIFAVFQGVKAVLPDSAFRLGFTNGMMSESMFVWFAILLVWVVRNDKSRGAER